MERYLFLIEGFGFSEEWKARFYSSSLHVTNSVALSKKGKNQACKTNPRNDDATKNRTASVHIEKTSNHISQDAV